MALEIRLPFPTTADCLPAGSIFLAYDPFRVRICVSLGPKRKEGLYALVLAGALGDAPERQPYPQVVQFNDGSDRTHFARLPGDFIVTPLSDIRTIPPSLRPSHGDFFVSLNGDTGVYTAVDDGPGAHISLTGGVIPVQKPVHYYSTWKIILRTPDTLGDHHYMEIFRRERSAREANARGDVHTRGLFQLIRDATPELRADARNEC